MQGLERLVKLVNDLLSTVNHTFAAPLHQQSLQRLCKRIRHHLGIRLKKSGKKNRLQHTPTSSKNFWNLLPSAVGFKTFLAFSHSFPYNPDLVAQLFARRWHQSQQPQWSPWHLLKPTAGSKVDPSQKKETHLLTPLFSGIFFLQVHSSSIKFILQVLFRCYFTAGVSFFRKFWTPFFVVVFCGVAEISYQRHRI